MRGRVWALLAFAAAVAGVMACSQVGTNPKVPVAMELAPPPLPAMLVGDSMRDSTGAVVPLRATVFNSRNDTIVGAAVTYLALDTTGGASIAVDPATGRAFANDTGRVFVVAVIGGLQSPPDTLVAVDTPTVLLPLDSLVDTLDYTFTGRDTLLPLNVQLLRVVGADTAGIAHWLVHYAVTYPAGYDNSDSTLAQLVDGSGRPALVDTTDFTGATARSLRVRPSTRPFADTLVIEATAALPGGTAVSGSPVRYVVHLTIQ